MTKSLKSLDSRTISGYRELFSLAPEFKRIYDSKDHTMIDELYEFYDKAARLLGPIISNLFENNLLNEGRVSKLEYTFTGHGMTYTNLKGELTGNLGSMLICPGDDEIYAMVRKSNKNVSNNKVEALVKHAIERGSLFAMKQHEGIDPDCIRFSSDIPRALHHAILKYDPSKAAELEAMALKPMVKSGVIDQKDYLHLVNTAIDLGIIPTPLLRAQFFGEGEMMKSPESNKILEEFKQKRRDLNYRISYAEGSASESYLHFCFDRGFEFLRMLANEDGVFVDKADLVTHSGFFDIARAYFRYLETRSRVILGRTETEQTRGGSITIKLEGSIEENRRTKYVYLNDPSRLDDAIKRSSDSADGIRQSSLDRKIAESEKEAIIPVEMIGFRCNQDNFFPYSIMIDDLVQYDKSILLLGHVGQGKTIAAIDLYDHFLKTKERTPFIISAKEINAQIHNKLTDDAVKNDRIILDILTRGISSLPKELREDLAIKGRPEHVYIIDALDELREHKENVIHAIKDRLHEYGSVIATSRFDRFNSMLNEGFETLNLDDLSMARNLKKYLEMRISDQEGVKELYEFIQKQDVAVRCNYLMIHFLTEVYKRDPKDIHTWKGPITPGQILLEGIQNTLFEHRQTKDPNFNQKPKPYLWQDRKEYNNLVEEYESQRRKYLLPRVKFLSRIAAHMTLRNKSEITREEIEEAYTGLAVNYLLEERGYKTVRPGFRYSKDSIDELLRDVKPILNGDGNTYKFTHQSFQEYHTADELVLEIEDYGVTVDIALLCCIKEEVQFGEKERQALREQGIPEENLPKPITIRSMKPWAEPVLLNMYDIMMRQEAEKMIGLMLSFDPAYLEGLKIRTKSREHDFAEACLKMIKRNPGENTTDQSKCALAHTLMGRYFVYGDEAMDCFKDAISILNGYNINLMDVAVRVFKDTGINFAAEDKNFDLVTNFYKLAAKAFIETDNLESAIDACDNGQKEYTNQIVFGYFEVLKSLANAKKGDVWMLKSIKQQAMKSRNPWLTKEMLDIGDALYESKNYPDALEIYQQIVELETNSFERLIMDCYPNPDTRADTIKRFDKRKVIAISYLKSGMIHMINGNQDQAEKAFSSAIKERDYTPEAHFRLAEIYSKKGVTHEADFHYLLALSHCTQKEMDNETYKVYFDGFSGVLADRSIDNPRKEISKLAAEKGIKIRMI